MSTTSHPIRFVSLVFAMDTTARTIYMFLELHAEISISIFYFVCTREHEADKITSSNGETISE